jgi:hypothetical protein
MRLHIHFTPTSAYWLNVMAPFFRYPTLPLLQWGVFTNLSETPNAIDQYIAQQNDALQKTYASRAQL